MDASSVPFVGMVELRMESPESTPQVRCPVRARLAESPLTSTFCSLAPAGGEALPVQGQPGSGPTLPWPSGQDTKAHSWSSLLCLKLASL